ncbi:MAG: serine/threonine protein kinase [Planctomycetes bacterium]|nr:serine/threonine protein kinase [Planctomycetota bacterium]
MSDATFQRFKQHLLAHEMVSEDELQHAEQALGAAAAPSDSVEVTSLNGRAPSGSDQIKALSKELVKQMAVTPNQVRRIINTLKEESTTVMPEISIPGYEIISQVGRGSQAVVYKAKQLSMDRVVALKVLDRKMAETADFKDRFVKEARSAAQLSHNNIVQAYDAGESAGINYFVQEFVEGTTVADVLKERGRPMGEQESLDIIIQIADALAHAHERGFIHRDVKPKNIMLTPQHVAKLADMGLARQATDTAAAEAEAGKAYGTPYYIAPEQVRGDPNIDFRADIYSLGATLYQMVTGRVPFEAPKPQQVMQKHLTAPLVPPDHINQKLSAGISEVIEVMMGKNPRERYASTRDLLMDLKSVRNGEPPALARQLVDRAGPAALAGLAEGEEVSSEAAQAIAQGRPVPQSAAASDEDEADDEAVPPMKIALIVLAALLAVSIIINLILAFR